MNRTKPLFIFRLSVLVLTFVLTKSLPSSAAPNNIENTGSDWFQYERIAIKDGDLGFIEYVPINWSYTRKGQSVDFSFTFYLPTSRERNNVEHRINIPYSCHTSFSVADFEEDLGLYGVEKLASFDNSVTCVLPRQTPELRLTKSRHDPAARIRETVDISIKINYVQWPLVQGSNFAAGGESLLVSLQLVEGEKLGEFKVKVIHPLP